MNHLLPQEEELYQETERFLENCLAFQSSNVGVQEFYHELAAAKGIKIKEIKTKLSVLHNRIDEFRDVFIKLKESKNHFEATVFKKFPDWPFEDEKEAGKVDKFIAFCGCSSSVKSFERFVRCTRRFYKSAADIVEDFWDYLLPSAKKSLQDIAYSMLEDRSKDIEGWGLQTLSRYLRELKPIYGHPLYKPAVLAVKSHSEALRFISAVFNAIGQGDPDEGLYNAEVMKQFLDLLLQDLRNNPSKLVPYTEEMGERAKDLISGVEIEE